MDIEEKLQIKRTQSEKLKRNENFQEKFKDKISVTNKDGSRTRIVGGEVQETANSQHANDGPSRRVHPGSAGSVVSDKLSEVSRVRSTPSTSDYLTSQDDAKYAQPPAAQKQPLFGGTRYTPNREDQDSDYYSDEYDNDRQDLYSDTGSRQSGQPRSDGLFVKKQNVIQVDPQSRQQRKSKKLLITANELQQLVQQRQDERLYIPSAFQYERQQAPFSARSQISLSSNGQTPSSASSSRVFHLSNVMVPGSQEQSSSTSREYRSDSQQQLQGQFMMPPQMGMQQQQPPLYGQDPMMMQQYLPQYAYQQAMYQAQSPGWYMGAASPGFPYPEGQPGMMWQQQFMQQQQQQQQQQRQPQQSQKKIAAQQVPDQSLSRGSQDSAARESDEFAYSKKPRDVQFKPYTFKDYKNLQNPPQLGGLGPDLLNEELLEKKNRLARMREYARGVSEFNTQQKQQEVKSSKASTPATREPVAPSQLAQVKAKQARERMMEFASKIPKPKIKSKSQPGTADDSALYGSENGDDEDIGEPRPMTELERLEQLHQQDQEWLRKEFRAGI